MAPTGIFGTFEHWLHRHGVKHRARTFTPEKLAAGTIAFLALKHSLNEDHGSDLLLSLESLDVNVFNEVLANLKQRHTELQRAEKLLRKRHGNEGYDRTYGGFIVDSAALRLGVSMFILFLTGHVQPRARNATLQTIFSVVMPALPLLAIAHSKAHEELNLNESNGERGQVEIDPVNVAVRAITPSELVKPLKDSPPWALELVRSRLG
jgi:hypothetical protein